MKKAAVFMLSWACVIGVVLLSDYAFRNHPGLVVGVWAVVILACVFYCANTIVIKLRAEIRLQAVANRVIEGIQTRTKTAEAAGGFPSYAADVPAFLRKGGVI